MKTTSQKHATSVEIAVILDKTELETARLKALNQLASKTKIAGFRKGKAPANVVEKHVDPNELANQTLDIAVRSALPKIFAKTDVEPISMPNVSITKYVPGETVEFSVKADILPEVKLGNYRKLAVKKPVIDTKITDVNDVLERIAKSFAEKQVVKRAAKLSDEVVIDFVGKKDDVAFDGGSAKDFKLELGSGQFIPGFEQGIVGHESGDKFDLKLTFPKDYHNKDLAGTKVVFEVLVKQVNEQVVPKIDDDLAKKSGAFQTLKELKDDIKKNLQAQNQRKAEDNYKDDLVMALVKASKVEAPESLVAEQQQFIRQDLERNLQSRGATLDQYLADIKKTDEEWQQEAKQAAEQRVKASIVLQTLAKELDIKVSDKDVAQKVTELKTVYEKQPDALKQLDDERVQADIKNRLRVEQTLDALVKANA